MHKKNEKMKTIHRGERRGRGGFLTTDFTDYADLLLRRHEEYSHKKAQNVQKTKKMKNTEVRSKKQGVRSKE